LTGPGPLIDQLGEFWEINSRKRSPHRPQSHTPPTTPPHLQRLQTTLPHLRRHMLIHTLNIPRHRPTHRLEPKRTIHTVILHPRVMRMPQPPHRQPRQDRLPLRPPRKDPLRRDSLPAVSRPPQVAPGEVAPPPPLPVRRRREHVVVRPLGEMLLPQLDEERRQVHLPRRRLVLRRRQIQLHPRRRLFAPLRRPALLTDPKS